MITKDCPAKWEIEIECGDCPYVKENLCDYPYVGAVKIKAGSDEPRV